MCYVCIAYCVIHPVSWMVICVFVLFIYIYLFKYMQQFFLSAVRFPLVAMFNSYQEEQYF